MTAGRDSTGAGAEASPYMRLPWDTRADVAAGPCE